MKKILLIAASGFAMLSMTSCTPSGNQTWIDTGSFKNPVELSQGIKAVSDGVDSLLNSRTIILESNINQLEVSFDQSVTTSDGNTSTQTLLAIDASGKESSAIDLVAGNMSTNLEDVSFSFNAVSTQESISYNFDIPTLKTYTVDGMTYIDLTGSNIKEQVLEIFSDDPYYDSVEQLFNVLGDKISVSNDIFSTSVGSSEEIVLPTSSEISELLMQLFLVVPNLDEFITFSSNDSGDVLVSCKINMDFVASVVAGITNSNSTETVNPQDVIDELSNVISIRDSSINFVVDHEGYISALDTNLDMSIVTSYTSNSEYVQKEILNLVVNTHNSLSAYSGELSFDVDFSEFQNADFLFGGSDSTPNV